MRRSFTRFAVVLVACVAGAASARWDVLSVNGTPKSVHVADAGYFAVATSTGAFAMLDDGGTVSSVTTGAFAEAFVDSRGCLGAIANGSTTTVTYANACASNQTWANVTFVAYRSTGANTGYLLGFTGPTGPSAYLYSTSAGVNGWQPLDSSQVANQAGFNARPIAPLSVLHQGGVDTAVFGLSANQFQRIGYVQDAGTVASFGGGGTPPEGLALIDPTRVLDLEFDGGVSVISGIPSTTATFTSLNLANPSSAVAFSPGTDSDGAGFGFIAPLAGAGQSFLTSEPSAATPGENWVASTAATPAYLGNVIQMDCLGAQFCVGITNNLSTSNVVLYENASPPAANVPPLVVIDAGTAVSFAVDAGDNDGDAIRLDWATDAGTAVTVTVPPSTDGRNVTLAAASSAMPCATATADFPVTATITDGWSAHHVTYPLTVQVPRVFSVLSTAQLGVDAGYVASDNSISGTVDVNQVNCPANRGLHADVTLSSTAGVLGDAGVDVFPAAFHFPLQGCAGGQVNLTTTLSDTSGTGAPTPVVQSITAPAVPAKVGAISTPTLIARCGQPVQGQLSVAPAPGSCVSSTFSWTQVSGPALATPSQAGASFALETVSDAPKDLIGQTVTLAVTADAANGTLDTTTANVTIGAAPFISLSRAQVKTVDPDLPGSVKVDIDNPTGCDLPATSVVERLAGLRYVEGSARLDGAPITAQVEGDSLRVDGVPLAAGAHHVFSFDARPSILGSLDVEGEVRYRDIPVSQPTENTVQNPSVGCGCRTASDGAGVVLLLALFLIVRVRHGGATERA